MELIIGRTSISILKLAVTLYFIGIIYSYSLELLIYILLFCRFGEKV